MKDQGTLRLPDPREWNGKQSILAPAGNGTVELTWLAVGAERDWVASGTTRSAPGTPKRA